MSRVGIIILNDIFYIDEVISDAAILLAIPVGIAFRDAARSRAAAEQKAAQKDTRVPIACPQTEKCIHFGFEKSITGGGSLKGGSTAMSGPILPIV
ncbi:MAG: hypothetical protein C0511_14455 [Hyphomicrobium sp.]|nr:hypothetical protein [Hyphomicrobium sp.]